MRRLNVGMKAFLLEIDRVGQSVPNDLGGIRAGARENTQGLKVCKLFEETVSIHMALGI